MVVRSTTTTWTTSYVILPRTDMPGQRSAFGQLYRAPLLAWRDAGQIVRVCTPRYRCNKEEVVLRPVWPAPGLFRRVDSRYKASVH